MGKENPEEIQNKEPRALQYQEVEKKKESPENSHLPAQDTHHNLVDEKDKKKQMQLVKKDEKQKEEDPAVPEKLIQKHKSNFQVYFLIVSISFGSFFIGYYLAVFNMSWKKAKLMYEIDENEALMKGMLTGSLPFGALFGCLFAGNLLKKFGERRSCMILDVIGVIFGIMFIMKNYYVALIARLVLGVVMGLNEGIIPIYVKNMSPMSISGKTGSFFQMFASIGNTLSFALGQAFPLDEEELEDFSETYLQFVLGVPILTCFLRFVVLKFFYKHTTAQNYILLGRKEKARQVIQEIYKEEYQQEQFEILEHEMAMSLKYSDTWKQVFSDFNWPRLKLGCNLMLLYEFSGIGTVLFYSKDLFETASGSEEAANILTLIAGVCLILFAVIAAEVSKYYGRRPILLWGYVGVIVVLVALATTTLIYREDSDNDNLSDFAAGLSVSLVYCFLIVFNFTVGTVTWYYNADILTGLSVGFVSAILQIGSSVIGFLFPIAKEQFGIYSCFYSFAIILALGTIYLYKNLQETKGLSRHQVQQMFMGNLLHLSGSQYLEVRKKSEMFQGDNIKVQDD